MSKQSAKIKRIRDYINNGCKLRHRHQFQNEDFTLTKDESGPGWYFQCKMCQEDRCTGYIVDD